MQADARTLKIDYCKVENSTFLSDMHMCLIWIIFLLHCWLIFTGSINARHAARYASESLAMSMRSSQSSFLITDLAHAYHSIIQEALGIPRGLIL